MMQSFILSCNDNKVSWILGLVSLFQGFADLCFCCKICHPNFDASKKPCIAIKTENKYKLCLEWKEQQILLQNHENN